MRSTTITAEGRRIRRRIIWAIGVIVAYNIALLIARAVDRSQVIEGPPGSTYTTAAEGTAAWHDLLVAIGVETSRLEAPIIAERLDPRTTLVIIEPGFAQFADSELKALDGFVTGGGRLVLGGLVFSSVLQALLDQPPTLEFGGPTSSVVWAPTKEVASVSTLAGSGTGHWSEPGGALPIAGGAGQATVLIARSGEGIVVLIADAGMVANATLGEADNATFAVAITGGRPVVFDEYVHGFGQTGMFGALPWRWRWMLGLLAGAAVAWMVAVGRRLGSPEDEVRSLPPERRLYVDSLASLLARKRDPAATTEPLRRAARQALSRRAGLPSDAPPQALRQAAGRLGFGAEIEAVLEEPQTDDDLIAADHVLARIVEEPR